ncbi:MAG: transcription antitermination factor NusB [Bacteroidales bacterium]|nr:transcription antitermination factor NusB [Bacteroidales bacterium]
MFNRRIIRIKVLQTLFAYYSGALSSLQEAENDLKYAFDRAYDLYFFLLLLVIELRDLADNKLSKAKKKFLPTDLDLNPNTKFVNNKLIVQLKENNHLNLYLKDRKYTWTKDPDLLKEIYEEFIKTDAYTEYLASDDNSYKADKNIIESFFIDFLFNSETLYSALEEESIYWVDGIDYVLKKIAKSISKFSIGDDMTKKLLLKFKNSDDLEYGLKLLHKSILKKDEFSVVVQDNIVNWDFDRISFIDKIILQLAVTELIEFDEIPIKVTLNEYIELAKWYGIPKKSSNFVNGILDKIVKDLKEKDKIKKSGRGLKDK